MRVLLGSIDKLSNQLHYKRSRSEHSTHTALTNSAENMKTAFNFPCSRYKSDADNFQKRFNACIEFAGWS